MKTYRVYHKDDIDRFVDFRVDSDDHSVILSVAINGCGAFLEKDRENLVAMELEGRPPLEDSRRIQARGPGA